MVILGRKIYSCVIIFIYKNLDGCAGKDPNKKE